MPLLRQVLPERLRQSPEARRLGALLDQPVKAIKLATGSPCAGKAELFAAWPGDHRHVRQWFLLANGRAVAVDEDPSGEWTCPVIDLDP